jgi:hypothetical protein
MDGSAEEITMDAFRAKVLAANKKHGKDAVKILTEYGSSIKSIKPEKYREILDRLEELDA